MGKWHLKHLFINLGLKTTFKMYLDGQFDQKIMFSKKCYQEKMQFCKKKINNLDVKFESEFFEQNGKQKQLKFKLMRAKHNDFWFSLQGPGFLQYINKHNVR